MADWGAVAQVVNQRMADKGINQRELADLSGVSVATLRQIQQGMNRRRSPLTLGAISRALGLPADHLRNVAMAGSDTMEAAENESAGCVAALREEVEELRARVAAIEAQLPKTF